MASGRNVAGQTNQVDASRFERRNNFAVMLLARSALTFDDERFNSSLSSFQKSGGGRLVANHDRDFSVRNRFIAHGVGQRDHIRTTSGDQNGKAGAHVNRRKSDTV